LFTCGTRNGPSHSLAHSLATCHYRYVLIDVMNYSCVVLLTYIFQVLKKISRYIQEQNNTVYIPRGLLLVDPIERGLRVVSFIDVLVGWQLTCL